MGAQKNVGQDLICFNQVPYVGPAKIVTGVAAAAFFQRRRVGPVLTVVNVETAAGNHRCSVASKPGGEDTIKNIDPSQNAIDDILRCSDAH